MRTLRLVALLSLSLVWPDVRAQKIRSANGLEAGLKGEYFNGPNFERKVMTRTDPQVNFNWNWESPGPGVQREYFSVRWTGKLYAPTSGKYRFSATVDDGVRVWVNGKKVIDEWRKQDDSNFVGEIALTGKQFYDLRIEYYNDWKGSVISVFWESPEDRRLLSFISKPQQTIPAQYLFSKPDRPPAVATVPVKRIAVVGKREPVRAPLVPVAASRPVTLPAKPSAPKPTLPSVKRNITPIASALAEPTEKPKPTLPTPEPVKANPTPPVDQSLANPAVGKAIAFQNVTFAQSDYTLLPQSYDELDKLVQVLQRNPTFRVAIAGHTDNVGDKRLNVTLSEFRAKVVATYLSRHGISDTRITYKGYGGSQPITDNTNEARRSQNRRVEFTLVE